MTVEVFSIPLELFSCGVFSFVVVAGVWLFWFCVCDCDEDGEDSVGDVVCAPFPEFDEGAKGGDVEEVLTSGAGVELKSGNPSSPAAIP